MSLRNVLHYNLMEIIMELDFMTPTKHINLLQRVENTVKLRIQHSQIDEC